MTTVFALFGLAACGGSETGIGVSFAQQTHGNTARSGFVPIDASVRDLEHGIDVTRDVIGTNVFGGGVAFAVGCDFDDGYVAVAGIDENTDPGLQTTGTASFDGRISWGGYVGIADDGSAQDDLQYYQGDDDAAFQVNFDAGTFSGAAQTSDVTMTGSINGINVSGDVDFFGRDAVMVGVVGQDGTAGAFHGGVSNGFFEDETFSGIFTGN